MNIVEQEAKGPYKQTFVRLNILDHTGAEGNPRIERHDLTLPLYILNDLKLSLTVPFFLVGVMAAWKGWLKKTDSPAQNKFGDYDVGGRYHQNQKFEFAGPVVVNFEYWNSWYARNGGGERKAPLVVSDENVEMVVRNLLRRELTWNQARVDVNLRRSPLPPGKEPPPLEFDWYTSHENRNSDS